MHDGETIWVPERVIVSPSSGVFRPSVTGQATDVREGDVIGHVECAGDTQVAVTSPFTGRLVQVVAQQGERVAVHDRIAWGRAA